MKKTSKALLTSAVRQHISSRRNNVTSSRQRQRVKIVEVSPRDGLQNEPNAIVDVATKASLIAKLAQAGLTFIEAGSFVSSKVKQMANTREVLLHENLRPVLRDGRTRLSVLVPNLRGLQDFLDSAKALKAHGVNTSSLEIAVFASATEGFSRANLNVSRAEALDKLGRVAQLAMDEGIKVRGYVSCVVKVCYCSPSPPQITC
jgi:hydroxymethylglutaryl-CoA lyase